MSRHLAILLYLAAMIAIIVGIDFMLLKHLFWKRLAVNITIVLVFAASYFFFFRRR